MFFKNLRGEDSKKAVQAARLRFGGFECLSMGKRAFRLMD
jgi:hypothetical protein